MLDRIDCSPDDDARIDAITSTLRQLHAAYQALQTENERLRMELVAEASAAAEQKLRADQLTQQHRMQAQMHAQATQQLAELEARKPLPLSYRAGAMTSGADGGATVSLHFNDMAEAEAWFVAITDQHDAALVDKTANLQDRTAPLSDDDHLRLRSDVARAIWDVMREHEDRCGHALEDVDHKHQVWDCADAAIRAMKDKP